MVAPQKSRLQDKSQRPRELCLHCSRTDNVVLKAYGACLLVDPVFAQPESRPLRGRWKERDASTKQDGD
jgi:hypothetical protein